MLAHHRERLAVFFPIRVEVALVAFQSERVTSRASVTPRSASQSTKLPT